MDLEEAISAQVPIHQAIVGELLELRPESWPAIELRLQFGDSAPVASLLHPDTGETIPSSEELSAAAARLDEHRRKHGLKWLAAVFTARGTEGEEWKVAISFQ